MEIEKIYGALVNVRSLRAEMLTLSEHCKDANPSRVIDKLSEIEECLAAQTKGYSRYRRSASFDPTQQNHD